MMGSRILYDFQCNSCSFVEEKFVYSDVQQTMCSKCGKDSVRLISSPTIALDGTDPGFPDAHNKWADQHERAGRGKG
ncbi:MAG: hypothetical protein DRQ48_09470 [Gammaproteobacteria bacterium]|nr:MAG: hypothetical protein DRQ48_09470 [Gammaproteobacteria bacterium]